MKTNEPERDDPALRSLLKEWKVSQSLPPHFQEMAWRRIERAERERRGSVTLRSLLTYWIERVLPRPALATAYFTLLLAIGISVGWAEAKERSAEMRDALGARYARTVDPYLANR